MKTTINDINDINNAQTPSKEHVEVRLDEWETGSGWSSGEFCEYDYDPEMARRGYLTVDKGSVTVNGVSLTVCNPTDNSFQVAIIPYTFENTNFHAIKVGTVVNLEFDIIGKYISRMIAH